MERIVQRPFRFRVHVVDAHPRADVVELMQQQGFPGFFNQPLILFPLIFSALSQQEFRVVQGLLQGAEGGFRFSLGGIRSPVPGKVQFSPPQVFPRVLRRAFKVLLQGAPLRAGQALQIRFPSQVFQHVPRRAAAAVPKAEGVEQGVDMALLAAVLFPAVMQAVRLGAAVAFKEAQRLHPGAVRPFPDKILVGEALALRIGPQQLLGGEVRHVKGFEQLGQAGGKPEGVGLPGHAAIHPQLFPEPPFAP